MVANCFLWSREKPWITEGQVFQNYNKFYIVQKRTQSKCGLGIPFVIYFLSNWFAPWIVYNGCSPPKFPLLFSVTLCFVAHKTPGSGLSPQDESLPSGCGLRPMLLGCSEATTQEDRSAEEQHKAQVFKSTELRLIFSSFCSQWCPVFCQDLISDSYPSLTQWLLTMDIWPWMLCAFRGKGMERSVPHMSHWWNPC